jgi:predicted PurR-regulated permease PerM
VVKIQNVVNKSVFKRSINFLIFAVAITIVATVITYIINPSLEELTKEVGNNLPDQVKESKGIKKVWSFIVNNGFTNFKKGLGIIISAIPHYIFEVFAFCLFAAVLFKLNQVVRDKVRSVFKKDKAGTSLIKNVFGTVKI